MEQTLDVSFESEQSIMALQGARAERYVDTIRAISAPVDGVLHPPDEANKILLAIIEDYDAALYPELKLLSAEQLADSVIHMVAQKTLDPRGLRADATLDYRGEIFILDTDKLCGGCTARPVVFTASKECVSCKLSDWCIEI